MFCTLIIYYAACDLIEKRLAENKYIVKLKHDCVGFCELLPYMYFCSGLYYDYI